MMNIIQALVNECTCIFMVLKACLFWACYNQGYSSASSHQLMSLALELHIASSTIHLPLKDDNLALQKDILQ